MTEQDRFPDIQFEIERTLTDGAFTVVCWRARGTQRGVWPGIPPTQRAIDLTGCCVFEIHAGQIAHAWTYGDIGRMLQQLGIPPAPEATGTAG